MSSYVSGTAAASWSPASLQEGALVVKCDGALLSLPWEAATETGEEIVNIEWLFKGRSDELIAICAHGHLIVEPAYSGRVERLGSAGIAVSGVAASQGGNYSVEVQVTRDDASGQRITLTRTATVEVTGEHVG